MGDLLKPPATQTRIHEPRLLTNTTQGVNQKQAPLRFKGRVKPNALLLTGLVSKLTGKCHTMEETFPLFDVPDIKKFY